jgi:hypothetical protein
MAVSVRSGPGRPAASGRPGPPGSKPGPAARPVAAGNSSCTGLRADQAGRVLPGRTAHAPGPGRRIGPGRSPGRPTFPARPHRRAATSAGRRPACQATEAPGFRDHPGGGLDVGADVTKPAREERRTPRARARPSPAGTGGRPRVAPRGATGEPPGARLPAAAGHRPRAAPRRSKHAGRQAADRRTTPGTPGGDVSRPVQGDGGEPAGGRFAKWSWTLGPPGVQLKNH